MLHAAGTAALVESLGPEGAWDGLAHPLDKGLAQECRTTPAPMDPRLVSAAFGHGRYARVLLERCGIGEAVAALTEGHEQAVVVAEEDGRPTPGFWVGAITSHSTPSFLSCQKRA